MTDDPDDGTAERYASLDSTDMEILDAFETFEPMTSHEIAYGIGNPRAIRERLYHLEKKGMVRSKKTGARSVVWWLSIEERLRAMSRTIEKPIVTPEATFVDGRRVPSEVWDSPLDEWDGSIEERLAEDSGLNDEGEFYIRAGIAAGLLGLDLDDLDTDEIRSGKYRYLDISRTEGAVDDADVIYFNPE